MPAETRTVSPGPHEGSVRTGDGKVLSIPKEWELVPPGDAALTRRAKSGGPSWTVKQKKGRRTFSLGVLAEASRIAAIRLDLESERSTDRFKKRRVADHNRRQQKQTAYVQDFHQAVISFLDFAECHQAIADKLANAVTLHATPVGSGTVGRTIRIPIEQRAESAVIAWLRHQTTTYDNMRIARVKGERRETRRMLASQSRLLLEKYRAGNKIQKTCPLRRALVAIEN